MINNMAIDRILKWAVLLLIVIIPFQMYFSLSAHFSLSVAQIAAGLIFIVFLMYCVRHEIKVVDFSSVADWLIIGLIIASGVSIIGAADKSVSLKFFIKWMSMVLLYFVTARSIRSVDEIKKIIVVFSLTAAFVSVLGLWEFNQGFVKTYDWLKNSHFVAMVMNPGTLKDKMSNDSFNYVVQDASNISGSNIRAFGTFECAIAFSAYLGLILPFGLWIIASNRFMKVPAVFSIIVIAATVFLNFSRSAYLSAFLVGLVYMLSIKKMLPGLFKRVFLIFMLESPLRLSAPYTSYPFSNKSFERYEPSCPRIPVTSAFFDIFFSC